MSPSITKAHVSCWLDFQGGNYIAQALLIPLPRGSNHGFWACQLEGIIRYLVPDTVPLWFSLQTVSLAFNYCMFTSVSQENLQTCLSLTVFFNLSCRRFDTCLCCPTKSREMNVHVSHHKWVWVTVQFGISSFSLWTFAFLIWLLKYLNFSLVLSFRTSGINVVHIVCLTIFN